MVYIITKLPKILTFLSAIMLGFCSLLKCGPSGPNAAAQPISEITSDDPQPNWPENLEAESGELIKLLTNPANGTNSAPKIKEYLTKFDKNILEIRRRLIHHITQSLDRIAHKLGTPDMFQDANNRLTNLIEEEVKLIEITRQCLTIINNNSWSKYLLWSVRKQFSRFADLLTALENVLVSNPNQDNAKFLELFKNFVDHFAYNRISDLNATREQVKTTYDVTESSLSNRVEFMRSALTNNDLQRFNGYDKISDVLEAVKEPNQTAEALQLGQSIDEAFSRLTPTSPLLER